MTTWTIIKASAGSGKTYRLTELLTERLRRVDADGTHPYRPSQLSAAPVTRAAAAELKARIRTTLVDDGLL
ncbi:MAG: UvrD-helicase domain-containing protein [Corynebacterium sp.]|nr:UvrD-helicase domain-containing protein [Corynebacterium sp.]